MSAGSPSLSCVPQVPVHLQVHPDLRRHPQQGRQAPRGIDRHATFAFDDLVQPIRGHPYAGPPRVINQNVCRTWESEDKLQTHALDAWTDFRLKAEATKIVEKRAEAPYRMIFSRVPAVMALPRSLFKVLIRAT